MPDRRNRSRSLLFLAAALAALGVLTATGLLGSPASRPARPHGAIATASVPAAAQGVLSRSLGRDDRRYWLTTAPGGLIARNPGQHLSARFSAGGLRLRSGSGSRWPPRRRAAPPAR